MKPKTEWVLCPFCHSKTRTQIREDTVLINYPLFCPKCKHISLVNAKGVEDSSHIKCHERFVKEDNDVG